MPTLKIKNNNGEWESIPYIKGDKGSDGVGVSDTTITTEGILKITLTNGNVIDLGKVKGENGADGKSGNDGFSPIVEVSTVEDGYEVKITDKDGAKTFKVNHGAKGDSYTITEADYIAIAEQAAAIIDTELLTIIGEVSE